jgi:hypothetical protein
MLLKVDSMYEPTSHMPETSLLHKNSIFASALGATKFQIIMFFRIHFVVLLRSDLTFGIIHKISLGQNLTIFPQPLHFNLQLLLLPFIYI